MILLDIGIPAVGIGAGVSFCSDTASGLAPSLNEGILLLRRQAAYGRAPQKFIKTGEV